MKLKAQTAGFHPRLSNSELWCFHQEKGAEVYDFGVIRPPLQDQRDRILSRQAGYPCWYWVVYQWVELAGLACTCLYEVDLRSRKG